MKPIDNRQNKLVQTKAGAKHLPPKGFHGDAAHEAGGQDPRGTGLHGGAVFGLVSNLLFASKIAQSAKHQHLGAHNFDKGDSLLEHARAKRPRLVILDWDGCEREAFKLLKVFREDAALKTIPVVGYLSHTKMDLKKEAETAGCLRVYTKSEFTRVLDDLLIRYRQ